MAAPHQSVVRKIRNRVTRTRRAWQTNKLKKRGDGVADTLPHFVVYLCRRCCKEELDYSDREAFSKPESAEISV